MSIYVAKIYTVQHYGFRRLDEEKAFMSYEGALAYLREEFFEEEDPDGWGRDYFAEIAEYRPQGEEVLIVTTRYTLLGEVFATLRSDEEEERPGVGVDEGYVPAFREGDLVRITSRWGLSLMPSDGIIGVVTGVPKSYEDWRRTASGAWDPVYMVECIAPTGYMTHFHPMEAEMAPFAGELPEDLLLLGRLSQHFRGEALIDEKTLSDLRLGEIYAYDVRTIGDVEW